jgi:hypothetical protein
MDVVNTNEDADLLGVFRDPRNDRHPLKSTLAQTEQSTHDSTVSRKKSTQLTA